MVSALYASNPWVKKQTRFRDGGVVRLANYASKPNGQVIAILRFEPNNEPE